MTRTATLLVSLVVMLSGCAAPAADQAGSEPKKSEAAGADKAKAPEPQQLDGEPILTVENSGDLAALLSGPATGPSVNAFSEKYVADAFLEFDGFVEDIYINPREGRGMSTLNVRAGDADDPKHTGPVFQFTWIADDPEMEEFTKGTNVRVRGLAGAIYEFEPLFQMYLLEPESAAALTPR